MTLEQLYHGDPVTGDPHPDYWGRHLAKIEEIRDYIRGYLRPGIDAASLAEELMSRAEEMGRITDDTIHGEVASRYTTRGNPLPFEI